MMSPLSFSSATYPLLVLVLPTILLLLLGLLDDGITATWFLGGDEEGLTIGRREVITMMIF